MTARVYHPAGPTLKAFHESKAFVRGIRGPIGSGKTTAFTIELLRRARQQKPGPDGKRHTRFAIIRNTYGELTTTTLRTFHLWVPEFVGRFSKDAPLIHRIKTDEIDTEFIFVALDRPEDIRKLLSMELTGAGINEAREVPKAVLDTLTGRVGRYPPMPDGGPSWSGIIMDTNSPDTDHWWYRLAEEDTPEGFEFFAQPAGDGPDAENLENLPLDYYERVKAGKDDDWIKVYVRAEYGYAMDAKPVYPEYRDRTHVAEDVFPPIPGLPLYVGLDFGLTPAAIFAQRTARGQWRVCDEIVAEDMGVVRFADGLGAYLDENYPEYQVEAFGDPAGSARAQTDEKTCIDIVREYARIPCRPAPSNDFTLRREAVAVVLERLRDGDPGLIISPACRVLRKGFAGGYCYRRVQVAGDERYHDKAEKNQYSHPHDALQYLLSGAGEGRAVLRRTKRRDNPSQARTDYGVFT